MGVRRLGPTTTEHHTGVRAHPHAHTVRGTVWAEGAQRYGLTEFVKVLYLQLLFLIKPTQS